MNKKNKMKDISALTPFSVITLFIMTYFVYKDFDIRMIYGYSILFLYVIVYSLYKKGENTDITCKFSVFENVYIIIPTIVVLNICRPDSTKDYDIFSYAIALLVASLFMVTSDISCKDADKIFKIIAFFAICTLIFELVLLFFPDIQLKYMNIISNSSYDYNMRMLEKGYTVSLGGSVTYVDYILMLGMTVFIARYIYSENIKDLLKTIPFFLMMIAMGRRGEPLSALLAIIILKFIMDEPEKRRKNVLRGIVTIGVIIVACILLAPILKKSNILYRYILTIEGLKNGKDISSGRMELWAMALAAFKKKPIIGIGWSNFQYCIPEYFRVQHGHSGNGARGIHAVHNIYLQLLCETGLIFTIIIIGAMFILLISSIKVILNIKKSGFMCSELGRRALGMAAFSLTLQSYFLILGCLDPIFNKRIFWFIYVLAIKFVSEANCIYSKNNAGSVEEKECVIGGKDE